MRITITHPSLREPCKDAKKTFATVYEAVNVQQHIELFYSLSRILFLPTVPLIYCFERDGISEAKYRHIADFLFRLLK